jgi:ABC-2 type transport system ATP-binding protein
MSDAASRVTRHASRVPRPAALDVSGLTRRFGDFTAVEDVSFQVQAGEIFGFLGPNGAGKTTTIKMLTGLLLPTRGTALVAGIDVAQNARALTHRIGYMSQLFSLYGDLTVNENIELFAGLYGVGGAHFVQRRAWVLAMAGIEGQGKRVTADLPLGWKQRLALGCAVLHEPPILFLDEPTSGVDPIARRAFWDLIYALAGAGTTVLVSTHYMEEAEYCHRVILMNRGRVIAQGTPAELRTNFREPIFELHTGAAPRAVEALQNVPGILEASLFGRAVHVVATEDAPVASIVKTALAAHGLACDSLRQVPPSLEDVFVSLVRREGGALAG